MCHQRSRWMAQCLAFLALHGLSFWDNFPKSVVSILGQLGNKENPYEYEKMSTFVHILGIHFWQTSKFLKIVWSLFLRNEILVNAILITEYWPQNHF